MAFIKNFEEEERRFKHQATAHTTYSLGCPRGEKIFQINMYGTKWRECPEQASQIIQLDKRSAAELVDLLKNFFDL